MAKKFYAIKKGKMTGIFTGQWKQIEKKYIKGFPNPEFKGFNTKEEAEQYLNILKKSSERNKQLTEEEKRQQEEIANQRKKITQQISYSNENPKHHNMRIVCIVVKGHQKTDLVNKPGYYEYLLIDNKSGKYLKEKSEWMSETSPNRAIIKGLIDAINKLKTPCHIKIYAKTYIGFKKMIKESKSPNSIFLKGLKELLLNKGHIVEEIINLEEVDKFFIKYK